MYALQKIENMELSVFANELFVCSLSVCLSVRARFLLFFCEYEIFLCGYFFAMARFSFASASFYFASTRFFFASMRFYGAPAVPCGK